MGLLKKLGLFNSPTMKDSFNPQSIVLHDERAPLFKEEYAFHLDNYYVSAFKYGRKKIEQELNSWISSLENNSSVLDVGCGVGYFMEKVRERGKKERKKIHILGVDLARNMLHKAKTSYSDIFVLEADAKGLPFKDHSFDAVLNVEVLRYFQERHFLLNELYRILKPQGKLFITGAPLFSSNLYGFYNTVCRLLRLKKAVSCYQSFETIRSFRKNLESSGFKNIVFSSYFFGPYFLLDKLYPRVTPKLLKKMEKWDDYFSQKKMLRNFTNHLIAQATKGAREKGLFKDIQQSK